MNTFEHANWLLTIVFIAISGTIVASILMAQRGRSMFVRRIPGLSSIEEAVGRATEMGRPIYFSTGLQGINIITLQALSILTHVVRYAATQATRVIVGTADSMLLPVAEESVREAYSSVGKSEAYRAEDVRFVSGDQFAYALGSVGIMAREQTASNFYFGAFFAEALILTENGRALGSLQVAGCPDPTQIPFFVATCDYVVIGDEYYAASAYLTREPTLTGSLVGQDIAKAGLAVLIVLGIAAFTLWLSAANMPHSLARFLSLLSGGS